MTITSVFLVLGILFSSPLRADPQIWLAGTEAGSWNTATRYTSLWGTGGANGTTSNVREILVAESGTIKNFRVSLSAAPGGTASYTALVLINESSSGISCTMTGASTSCEDLISVASISAGDEISLQKTTANTPTAAIPFISIEFEPNTASRSTYGGGTGGNTLSGLTQQFVGFSDSGYAPSATVTDFEIVMPTGGTLRNLYVEVRTAPGGTEAYQFDLYVNGALSGVVCTISGASLTCNDTSNTVAVVAGDNVVLSAIPTVNGAPAATTVIASFAFDPINDGEFFFPRGSPTSLLSATRYLAVIDGDQGLASNEQTAQCLDGHSWVKGVYVELLSAPGGSETRQFNFRIDSANATTNVTLTGASVSGSAFGFNDGMPVTQYNATQMVPSGSAAASTVQISYLALSKRRTKSVNIIGAP